MISMEQKLKIIDEIVKFHPSLGVDKGWSHYTGGMKDSGDWYLRKMLDVPIEELKLFLDNVNQKTTTFENTEKDDVLEIKINGVNFKMKKSEQEALNEFYNKAEIHAIEHWYKLINTQLEK